MGSNTTWPTTAAFRIWRRNFESWKRYAASFFVVALGEPLFTLVAIGYGLGHFVTDIGGVPYAVFLAPAIVATAAMNSASFETTFGSFTRMTEQNTYTAILATPCSVADIVAGDILWAATKSLVSSVFVLIVTALLGLLSSPAALGLVPLGFLAGVMFGSMGMVVTGRAPSYDFFSYYFTLCITVMFLFSGVFFPLDILPTWAKAIAWALPLTHAVQIARELATGSTSVWLLGNGLFMTLVTVVAFLTAERRVRKRLVL